MRVSTASRYESTVVSLQRRQSDLSQAQLQMSRGKRVNQPSDDPTAASRAERALISQQRIASQQRSVQTSRGAMELAESALGQAGELMQKARETLVSAGNATYGPTERAALAKQLSGVRGQMLALANQADGAGGYIFGGQGSTSTPFLEGIGGVVFAGTGGQTSLSTAEQMQTTVDGQNIWLNARSGNGVFVMAADATNTGKAWIGPGGVGNPSALTGADYDINFTNTAGVITVDVLANSLPTSVAGAPYVPGQDIVVDGMSLGFKGTPAHGDHFTVKPSTPTLDPFSTLERAIALLQDPNANSGQVAQMVSDSLRNVDSLSSHVLGARSVAGATLQRLDSIDARNQDRNLWAKSVQSDAEDLDMVQAISEFKNQETSYQAALQSYATVQRMSLFDYIR